MAKFLVKETSYINHKLVPAGEIVEYDPPEGTTISSNLELVKRGKGQKDAVPDIEPDPDLSPNQLPAA